MIHRAVARAAVGIAVLLSVAVTAGCGSGGAAGYTKTARTALESAASEVATARLAVQQQLGHKVLGPFADQVVSSSETSLGGVADGFSGVQPPDHASDPVRDTVTGQLSDAQDAVAHARIAVRRGDPAALRTALGELDAAADGIEDAETQLGNSS